MPLSVQKLANRLSFRQLQVFKAVYNLRSYSQAGQQLGLTQPAVSSQMKQLEQAREQPLFEYVGRKLYCTAAGEMLSDSVDIIFEQLRLLQDDLMVLRMLAADGFVLRQSLLPVLDRLTENTLPTSWRL